MPTREVHNADALEWLEEADLTGCSVVTSLPDVSETNLELNDWRLWFHGAAKKILTKLPADSIAVFFQTDIKVEGHWVDKGYLVTKAAEEAGASQLLHKIICRFAPGTITFGRPAYSHLLAFSRSIRLKDLGKAATPDVVPDAGEKTWTRGMGRKACELAINFIKAHTPNTTIVDPFAGHGTVLAVANQLGLNAIGVELSAKRARKARTLA